MFVSLQNSHAEAVHSCVTVFVDRASKKEVIKVKRGHKDWSLNPIGLVSLYEETPQSSHTLSLASLLSSSPSLLPEQTKTPLNFKI